jgi:Holliday junction resolvase RusA-like endonuclease
LIAASDLLIDFPVRVEVVFAIPRSRTSKLIVPMGDGDNFEKAIFDLLQRKGYLMDDKYITSGSWVKRFLPFGKTGYTEVTIMEEPDNVDIAK